MIGCSVRDVFKKIREAVNRRILKSREKRAGRIAQDAAARAEELYDRGKTGSYQENPTDMSGGF